MENVRKIWEKGKHFELKSVGSATGALGGKVIKFDTPSITTMSPDQAREKLRHFTPIPMEGEEDVKEDQLETFRSSYLQRSSGAAYALSSKKPEIKLNVDIKGLPKGSEVSLDNPDDIEISVDAGTHLHR